MKYRLSQQNSFDAALGFGFGANLHMHADWLYEGDDLLDDSGARLGWFVGVGGVVIFDDHDDNGQGNDDNEDDEVDLGARVPVGLELRFSELRQLELFAEIALGIEIVDDPGPFLSGGIGARWFF